MRQLAWLNTAPRDEKKPVLGSAPAPEPVTRLKKMEADGIVPMTPPLPEDLPYIEWLLEIGPTEAGGMGAVAIGWRTLQAWQDCTGILLAPWEARLLRRLSGDWLTENERARKPDCPAPWSPEPTESSREVVARKMEQLFDRLERRPQRVGLR